MTIGDINVVESILNLERSVSLLTKIIEQIKIDNPSLKFPTNHQIEGYNNQTIRELANKYPNMDIKKK